jgi:transposase
MPRALPVSIRQTIVARHQQGESLAAIATALGLSRWTVRAIWRQYRRGGSPGLSPAYPHCGPPQPTSPRPLYLAALVLKRRHPRWGADLICLLLARRWENLAVPTPRTLQHWWRRAGLQHTRARRVPAPPIATSAPHAGWQLDATARLRLADGSGVSWLTVVDEATGAYLAAVVFPPLRLGASRPGSGAPSPAHDFRPMGLAGLSPGG